MKEKSNTNVIRWEDVRSWIRKKHLSWGALSDWFLISCFTFGPNVPPYFWLLVWFFDTFLLWWFICCAGYFTEQAGVSLSLKQALRSGIGDLSHHAGWFLFPSAQIHPVTLTPPLVSARCAHHTERSRTFITTAAASSSPSVQSFWIRLTALNFKKRPRRPEAEEKQTKQTRPFCFSSGGDEMKRAARRCVQGLFGGDSWHVKRPHDLRPGTGKGKQAVKYR